MSDELLTMLGTIREHLHKGRVDTATAELDYFYVKMAEGRDTDRIEHLQKLERFA